MIGATVGGYRLTHKLGEGAAGEVFLGEHASSGQKAAVQILFAQLCTDSARLGRFLDDVKAASRIEHSGIARLYDCGLLADGRGFLIFELLQGKLLTDALGELGRVSDVESLADIAWQMAVMLRAAHEARIVHAALTADAILLTFPPGQASRPQVKLLNFGMANFSLGARQHQTRTLLGAPLYMSPEIGRGLGSVDHRADIYSLGCLMFEMACGRPPFLYQGQGELLVAHATEAAPRVSSLEPSIPPAIDQLIGWMLSKNPLARPQDMGEVAAALEKFFRCPTRLVAHPTPLPPAFDPQANPDERASGDLQRGARATQPAWLPTPPQPTAVWQRPPVHPTPPGTCVPAQGASLGDPRGATAVLPPPGLQAAAAPAQIRPTSEATAPRPPEGAPAALVTVALPPEPQSSWLARVRQRTALIDPGANDTAWAPPEPEMAQLGSWSTARKRAGARPLAPREAARRPGILQAIDLRVVVISAAVVLLVGAVVLLSRRDSRRSFEKDAVSPAAIPSGLLPRPGARAMAPRAPAVEPSAAGPAPSLPAAAGGNSEQLEMENAAQDGRAGDGARQVHRTEDDGQDKTPGRSRQRW